jgi:MoxR-like ATPase
MEEHRVTIWDHTMNLGPPFHVFATRNHIEADGIYPLPVAQLDRFLFELVFPYPEEADEIKIAQQGNSEPVEVNKVCDPERLLNLVRFTSEEVYATDFVLTYAVKLIRETRTHEGIRLGASPRATQKLISASKAHALAVRREAFVTPDDVDAILEPLLNPRILLRNPFYDESEEQDEKKKIIEEVKRMAKEKHVR